MNNMNASLLILKVGFLFFLLSSCNSMSTKKGVQSNPTSKLTPAQITMKNCIHDLKNDTTQVKTILKKYFYNYEEILNNKPYDILYKRYYSYLKDVFTNDSYNIRYYWNKEIDTVPQYDWVNDNKICNENLLILVSDKENGSLIDHIQYCFTEKGKIYSNVTIVNPNDISATIWVRAEDKYVWKDSNNFYIEYPRNSDTL